MAKRRCQGKTKADKDCQAAPLRDSDYCLAHSDAETRSSMEFVGGQPGSGRPRKPRVVDVIKERIEADMERVLAPLFDALEAERTVFVGYGEDAQPETVADWSVRLAAARELLDRAYGKPRQTMEHSGPDKGAIPLELDAEASKAAHDFLARIHGA